MLEWYVIKGYIFEKVPKGQEEEFKEKKQNFVKLVSKLASSDFTTKDTLVERLDEQELHDAGLIDKSQFHKKKSIINTKNTYTWLW